MQRFYPAVLERGTRETFGVWFPDFPRAWPAARRKSRRLRAPRTLAQAVQSLAERERELPQPTRFEKVEVPKDCDLVAFFAVGVEPPDPSERVNIYLSKSLIARADGRAAELGMSRSSFFGYACTSALALVHAGFGQNRLGLCTPERARTTRPAQSETVSPRRTTAAVMPSCASNCE